MSKHTPGPWHWTVNYDCPGELKGAIIYDAHRNQIAGVNSRPPFPNSQKVCEANATLMADAPRLHRMAEAWEALVAAVRRSHAHGVNSVVRKAIAAYEEASDALSETKG